MTRINVVSPRDLTDEHLFAEWRELPRVFTLAAASPAGRPVPPAYTLGAGHMLFFLPRLGWLGRRHADLTRELVARGYTLAARDPLPTTGGDYTPDAAARAVNVARLCERVAGARRTLHYRGRPVPPTFYDRLNLEIPC